MKKNKGCFSNSILEIVLLLLWIIGIFHSYSKHSKGDAIFSAVVPPFGIYRGVEFFWHKDNYNLKEDKEICIAIFHQMENNSDDPKTIQDLYDFNTRIKKYPTVYIDSLKTMVNISVQMENIATNDMIKWVKSSNYGVDKKSVFKMSDSVSILSNVLLKYGYNDSLEISYIKQFVNNDKWSGDSLEIKERTETFQSEYLPIMKQKEKEIYNKMFQGL